MVGRRGAADRRTVDQHDELAGIGKRHDPGPVASRRRAAPAAQTWLLEASWVYDVNGKKGTLGTMLGVADTAQGTLTDMTADWFRRDYKYDVLLRPWSVSTHIPAGTDDAGLPCAEQDFNVEYGYDHNYGRMKAMSSPGPNQELVRFDYDARGIPVGETPLGSDLVCAPVDARLTRAAIA